MTAWQFFWLQTVAGMGFYFVTMPRTLVNLLESGAWLAPLLVTLILAAPLYWLTWRLPWGQAKRAGRSLLLLTLVVALLEGAVTLRRYGEFFNIAIMTETPILVIIILTLVLPLVLARGGLQLLNRFNLTLLPILIMATILVFILSYKDFDWMKLKPWFFLEKNAFLKASGISAGFTLNLLPAWVLSGEVKIKNQQDKWLIWAGLLLPSIILSLTTMLAVGIFGLYTVQRLLWPMLDVVKDISLAGFVERIEVAYIILWFYCAAIRLGILLYLAAWAATRLFRLQQGRILVVPLACWMLALAMLPNDTVQAVIKLDIWHFFLILVLSPIFFWLLARNKGQKITGIIILLVSCLLLNSGCWNRKEAEKIQYALAVGVDRTPEGRVMLTVQMPLLEKLKSDKTSQGPKAWTISSGGETTFEAIRHLIMATGAKLFFSHMQVLIIGEEAARDGIEKYIDIFSSDQEFRATPYVLVARGRAQQVLHDAPPYAPLPATFLKDQVEKVAFGTSATIKMKMGDFFAALASQGAQAPLAAVIEPMTWQKYSKQVLGLEEEARGQLEPEKIPYMAGTAFFRGTRLAGWLDAKETRGVLWVKGKVESGIIVVPQPGGGKISFEIIRLEKRKLTTDWRGDRPFFRLELEVEGNIGDKSGFTNPATGPNLRKLEQSLRAAVADEIERAWLKQKKYRVDLFGLGAVLAAERPQAWERVRKRWEVVMPAAELEMDIKVDIRRISTTIWSPWARGKGK
ncbi:MAG: Ger(x)C family spore germination protein [Bacillota bacterium]